MCGQQSIDFRSGLRLGSGHNNVFTAPMPASCLVEHLGRFADTGSVAEETLEPPSSLALFFSLNFCQKPIRIPPVFSAHLCFSLAVILERHTVEDIQIPIAYGILVRPTIVSYAVADTKRTVAGHSDNDAGREQSE